MRVVDRRRDRDRESRESVSVPIFHDRAEKDTDFRFPRNSMTPRRSASGLFGAFGGRGGGGAVEGRAETASAASGRGGFTDVGGGFLRRGGLFGHVSLARGGDGAGRGVELALGALAWGLAGGNGGRLRTRGKGVDRSFWFPGIPASQKDGCGGKGWKETSGTRDGKDKGQRREDKGQRTKDKGQRPKWPAPRNLVQS